MAKKRSRKGLIIGLVVLALLIAGTIVVLMRSGTEGPILVSVEPVAARTITQTVSAIGKLQPERMVKISSEASGEIIFLGAKDGDAVKEGQLLVRVRPDILESQLAQTRAATDAARMEITIAKAELDRSEADLKRVSELYKKEFATKEEFDRAKATYESAAGRFAQSRSEYARSQGALQQTQASASRTMIYSPMNGTVTFLGVEVGEKVVGVAQMQGTEMMRIADLSTMNAWVQVDENDVAQIHLGDTARIKVDAFPDVELRGVVYEIAHSPIVSGQGTQEEVVNFQVRIRIVDNDHRMRPGMSCSVNIETETKSNVLAVPIQSVTMQQDAAVAAAAADDYRKTNRKAASAKSKRPQSIVWVVNGTTVASRRISTGISDEGFIEVVSGLKTGDRVVTSPYEAISKLLTPGATVAVEDPSVRRERYRSMRQDQ